jgi:hypothetical protein
MPENKDHESNMYWDSDYMLHKRGEPRILPSQYIFRGEKEAMHGTVRLCEVAPLAVG